MPKKLQEIKKKIQEANLESLKRPIRLADILLAIGKRDIGFSDFDNEMLEFLGFEFGFYPECSWCKFDSSDIKWNLKNNNLDNQSEETINFLYELLCKT